MNAPPKEPLSPQPIFVGYLIAGIFSSIFLCMVCMVFPTGLDSAHQTRFSPDKLAFRSTSYYCVEFLGSTTEWSLPLLDRIREFDDGTVQPTAPAHWHEDYDARRILRQEQWLEWTDQHPLLAKRLWPEMIRLFRQERYSQARYLILLAEGAKTMADLDRAIVKAAEE